MSNTVKISLKGREFELKFGALSVLRKLRTKDVDLGKVEGLSIDELYVFIIKTVMPDQDHFWQDDDELIEALDENSHETLKAIVDGFNSFLGFTQTLVTQSESGAEKPKKGRK